MENVDKRFTVPKWILIDQPKITQMPKKKYLSKLSAQAQKFGILFKKGFKGHP